MKELTNLELLMEYMEQNQYFIGNDLLAKYNELLQKEEEKQCTIPDVSIMSCDLGREFHKCEIHRCGTYGCLNCGQYTKQY